MEKQVIRIVKSAPHTVGDGFAIRRPLPGAGIQAIDPFLLLDHAGPTVIRPSDTPRGVDEHPHKGFETVTIVLQGELQHRDSAGNSGALRAGDVQWMTAASGIVHEEKHGEEFTRRGGTVEIVQLWVNLPARFKTEPPAYQDLRGRDIPVVGLEGGGAVRVIAGAFGAAAGAARTFIPVDLLDVGMRAAEEATIAWPEGHTAGLYVIRGAVTLSNGESVRESELAGFTLDGTELRLRATEESRFLLLGGEPIDEPVVTYGPFVMSTMEEIRQAYQEYREGAMGTIDIPIVTRGV